MPETALVSFRRLAFVFPLVANYLVTPSTPLNPLRLVTTAPVSSLSFLASKFRNRSFWSKFLFSIVFFTVWQLGIDIFWWISMSNSSNTVSSCADSRILNLYRLFPRYHQMGFSSLITEFRPILNRNPVWYCCEEWQRMNRRNRILYHERQSLESDRRSWRRSVFLVGTGPLSGLFLRDWPSSCIGNSGWSCSEQKQPSRPESQKSESSFQRRIARTSSHLIIESYLPNKKWLWIREFVWLQLRNLLSLLSQPQNSAETPPVL